MTSTGKIGPAFKLMKVAGAYWRGDFEPADAVSASMRRPSRRRRNSTPISSSIEEAETPRPSPARPRDGPVPFPGGGAGHGLLASEGLDAVPDAHRLYAPAPAGGRLCRGQHAAGARPRAVGDLGPLADLSREHVHHQDRGRARLRAEADELPRPYPDLQERLEVLPRSADEDRRIRHRPSLRAVRRDARHHARARLHAGRRAYLLHRRPDHGRGAEGQRPDHVDLRRFRLRRRRRQAFDAAGKARRLGRGLGQGGGGADAACSNASPRAA